ncbi:MAG: site-specific integrase [bacterium]|nr:site-specific integrase [bacterium]
MTQSRDGDAYHYEMKAGRRWGYVVDLNPPGAPREQQRRQGFRTKAEAAGELRELLASQSDGTHVKSLTLTFGDYLTQWVDDLRHRGRAKTTCEAYEGLVRNHVCSRPIVGRRLQHLHVTELDDLYVELAKDGKVNGGGGLAPRTIRHLHSIILRALREAEEKGLVQSNIARRASAPTGRALRSPVPTTWTQLQLSTFLQFAQADPRYALWRTAAMTGLRRGELIALTWSAVDLDRGRLSVRRSTTPLKSGELVTTEPKSKDSRRTLGLDADTVSVLRVHREEQAEWSRAMADAYDIDADLVFTGLHGECVRPRGVSDWFGALVKQVGLPKLRFHDLRHTHATILLQRGVSAKTVSQRLGHSSVAFTLSTYVHDNGDLDRDVIEALGEDLDPKEGGEDGR